MIVVNRIIVLFADQNLPHTFKYIDIYVLRVWYIFCKLCDPMIKVQYSRTVGC